MTQHRFKPQGARHTFSANWKEADLSLVELRAIARSSTKSWRG
jgi:hypothetical protein